MLNLFLAGKFKLEKKNTQKLEVCFKKYEGVSQLNFML